MFKAKTDRKKEFSMIVSQYSETLYWKIRRMVLDHDDADDVLQNVFVKAWNNFESFQNKSKVSTWLYRIAINESLDFLRRQKKFQTVNADESLSVGNRLMADDYFDGNRAQALLQAVFCSL